jgi:hypothetical protein
MIDVIITGVVGLISSIISGVVSWLTAKKKYNAEVDSTIIENLQKSLDFYEKLVNDNTRRLDDVLKRNEALERSNLLLEEKVANLSNQIFTLMAEICLDFSCQRRVKKPDLFGPIKTINNLQNTK